MRVTAIFMLILVQSALLLGQKFKERPEREDAKNKGNAILLHISFGGQLPAGDLKDRFGPNGSYGGGVDFMTKSNYFIGVEGHALFGQKVKDDPLSVLRTPEGYIIGNDRSFSTAFYRERGFYAGGALGKLFNFGEKRSGIRISLGGGWLQHFIKIQDQDNALTQITGDYAKGYDRLTGGIALNQFVGWQKLGKLKRSNFMAGLEFNQGFTNTRRDWDFSERKKLEGKRLDLRFGVKVALTLPFYFTKSSEIFY